MLDSARQNDELSPEAAEVAIIREKLEGKQKQDLDAGHSKIRDLEKAERGRRRHHFTVNSALAAAWWA